MADININGLVGLQSVTSNILVQLGYTGWALKSGSYNGCTYASFVRSPFIQNSQIAQIGEDIIASYNQITGTNNTDNDANGYGQLFSTVLGTLQFSDDLIQQIAIKGLPYANRCNTEDMGSGGYEFRMTLLFIGPDYKKAIANLKNAIQNPPTNTNYLKLVHPTLGDIPGITRVTSFRTDTNLANWNAATVNITFRSEQSNAQQSGDSDLPQQISRSILAGLGSVLAINGAITAFNALLGNSITGTSTPTSPTTYTTINTIQKSNEQLSKYLFNNMNYIYKNSNTGVTNNTLASTAIDYSYISPALNQVVASKYTVSQGNIILGAYVDQCAIATALIDSYDLGGLVSEMKNTITVSITDLYNMATLMAPVPSNLTYAVPYDMSIREVLARNNIPFQQVLSVLSLNPNILSANWIRKGEVINL